jgi:1-acyl-sn-glycerol-3-phosphate acyltransferase
LQQTFFITKYYRIARVIFHTLLGVLIAAFVFPLANKSIRLRITRAWCKSLLNCFNIKVVTYGTLPDSDTNKTMFIANHISWTDIHAINSIIPVRFIAKIEIKSWPIFGYLVSKSGTLFINRSIRKDAARIVDITADSLKADDNVCFFPEGTTTEGTHMLPFKSSITQAAVDADAVIWPVAIYYPTPNRKPNINMAFAGETTMIESMSAMFKIKNPIVELHFLPPISGSNETRHTVTEYAYTTIKEKFNLLLN